MGLANELRIYWKDFDYLHSFNYIGSKSMAKFIIVKHRLRYHVIGYEGLKRPRKTGKKATYREQCISSHYTVKAANKAKAKYEASKLKLSCKAEPKTVRRLVKELGLAFWLAVASAVIIELYIKFIIH
jgi:hypothetical protein